MARRPWMPCCKPCRLCDVCIPGTYNSTYAAVVRFFGKPTYNPNPLCDCTGTLIGPEFELSKTGIKDHGQGMVCCRYELNDMTVCYNDPDNKDSWFNRIAFEWCSLTGSGAVARLELGYVCDQDPVPQESHVGEVRFTCHFTWSEQDQTKGRYCNQPVGLVYEGQTENCDDYSLCGLADVTAVVRFLPPGPPGVIEEKCPAPEWFTGMALWGGPTSAIYAKSW